MTGTLWDLPSESFRFTEELNKGADGSITIPFPALSDYATRLKTTAMDVIASGFRRVIIKTSEKTYVSGVVSSAQFTFSKGKGITAVVLSISDWFAMLAKRRTAAEKIYTSDDSADIAWDLINTTQTDTSGHGNLGITRGVHPVTKNRDRTFKFDNVRDALVGMSASKVKDGYDMDIDADRKFNIYYPQKGTDLPAVIFDSFNVTGGSYNIPLAGKLINRCNVLGKTSNVTREDTSTMANWYLHEDVLSERDVETTDLLNDRGDKQIADNRDPDSSAGVTIEHLDGEPSIADYSLGDRVKFRSPEIQVDQMMRVIKRAISYQRGHATVTATLEL